MNDPTYYFVKGQGWVPTCTPEIIGENEFKDWHDRQYPPVCYGPGWQKQLEFPRQQTKIGDVIPYTGECGVVTKITKDYIYMIRYSRGGEYKSYEFKALNDGHWYDVMRYVG